MDELTRDDLPALKRLAGVLHRTSGELGWLRRRRVVYMTNLLVKMVYSLDAKGTLTHDDVTPAV